MQASPLDCSIDWIWYIEKGPPLFPVGKIIEMMKREGDTKRESSWGTIWDGGFPNWRIFWIEKWVWRSMAKTHVHSHTHKP